MDNIFDNNRLSLYREFKRYSILFIFIVILLNLGLFTIKKERIYENSLYFSKLDRAYLFTNKDILKILKERQKILIDDVEYDFIIEKIEKQDNNFLVYISFPIELATSIDKYQINLGKEKLLDFIIRIIKGE